MFMSEVSNAIYEEYKDELFGLPMDSDQWRAVAQRFGTKWNFHHCCGAIDGKHIDLDLFVVLRRVQQPGSYCDG